MFGFNELSTPVKAIIALAIVLLLVVIAGLILRRVAGGRLKLPGQGNRARQPRLGIVDIFEMDRQRQLVLLRRDNVEHLVMIGGPNDLVIEASILRSGTRAQLPVATEGPENPPLPESVLVVPQPPSRRAPQVGTDPAPAAIPAVPAPSLAPVAGPSAVATPPTSAPPAGTAVAGAVAAGAAFAGLAAMSKTASAAPDAAPQPASPPPPPSPPQPPSPPKTPGQPPVQAAAAIEPRFPVSPPPAYAPPAKPIIEPITPPPAAKATANELDDMTRQLEEALKRPFSGVKAPASVSPASAATSAAVAAASIETRVASEAVLPSPQDKQPEREADVAVLAKAGEAKTRPAETADLQGTIPEATGPGRPGHDLPEPDLHEPDLHEPDLREPDTSDMAPESRDDSPDDSVPLDFERELAAALSLDLPEMALSRVEPAKPALLTETASKAPTAPMGKPEVPEPVSPPAHQQAVSKPPPAPDQPAAIAKPNQDSSGSDPFSVDAIEAEFARLLNRSVPPKL